MTNKNQSELTANFMNILKQSKILPKTDFVLLFGSVNTGKQTPFSDVDFCVSLNLPPKERLQARMNLLGKLPDYYDVQIFEDLPLYMKKSVLAGKLIYCTNQSKLVQRALNIIAEYEDFEPVYNYYIHRTRNIKESKVIEKYLNKESRKNKIATP